MSKSPGNSDLAGALRQPPSNHADDEIQAEIADHLATAAERLQAGGASATEAREEAAHKFGDPKTIARRCFWIRQGDHIMFRTAVIALLVILCLALGVTTFTSLRTQQQMARQMAALTEQLQAVAQQQRNHTAASLPTASASPHFTGRAFIGSADHPAADKQLKIIDIKDGSTVRTLSTDSEGKFDSGPLAGGDYALVADTGVRLPGQRNPTLVQSAPIAAYPGVRVPEQELNLEYPTARFALETNRPLPRQQVGDRYVIETRLLVRVHCSQDRSRLWILDEPPPLAWPIYSASALAPTTDTVARGATRLGGYRESAGREFYEILSRDDLLGESQAALFSYLHQLPAGAVEITAAVLADVLPVDFQRPDIPKERPKVVTDENRHLWAAAMDWGDLLRSQSSIFPRSLRGTLGGLRRENAPTLENDAYFWLAKGLGNIWLLHLKHANDEAPPLRPFLISPEWADFSAGITVQTRAGALARLRIEFPNDIERRIQELVDSTTDPVEFSKLTLGVDRHLSDSRSPFARGSTAAERIANPPPHRATPDTSPFFRITTIKVQSID